MTGKFELYKDRADKFRFRLKAGNGEIIAVSEAYNSRSSALGGVESVRKNAPEAKLHDQTS
ncbi:MAG: YegP family protein [Sciscionella sp.]